MAALGAVMSGFNRWGAYWCGAYDNLLTGFLRGELGMRGMIITDYSGSSKYMDLADGLIAGSDIWDSPDPTIHTTLAPKYENDAYIVTRNARIHAQDPVHRCQLQCYERLVLR